jgi:hypothetical protein
MKTTDIEFKEYGKGAMIQPNWGCIVEHDNNLRRYYTEVLNKPFTKKRFRRPGVFRDIERINNVPSFSNFRGTRCLDMPIKMAGSNEYRIPEELSQFIEPISKMISFETAHNERINDFYAYLTIDQSEAEPNTTHRHGGLHVDGFQGKRIDPKVECDRSYIVVDCDPPSFWNQSFKTVESMDDGTQNIFHEFDRTKHYSAEIKAIPYHIYLMDCYAVHGANPSESKRRTFCRLSYSVRQFDRLGNSHNYLFDYKWDMYERDISSVLM